MTIPVGCQTIDPCCGGLYPAASDLAQAVAAALVECQGGVGCGDLDAFVSHAEPVGIGHYVAVWLMRERFATSRTNMKLPIPTFGVRYVEPGYPRLDVEAGEPTLPDRADLDAAARHSYAHLQVMIDAVLAFRMSPTRQAVCSVVSIERASPDRIQAGFSGWTLEATWGYS